MSSVLATGPSSPWRDPKVELIADLETVVEATPLPCTDQMLSITDMQHFTTRILRRLDAAWDGIDPNAVDPPFEEEFAASRARWPRFYTQDPPDRTCPPSVVSWPSSGRQLSPRTSTASGNLRSESPMGRRSLPRPHEPHTPDPALSPPSR